MINAINGILRLYGTSDVKNIFFGKYDTNWHNAANWSLGTIPSTNSDVIIAAQCNINSGVTVNSILIQKDRVLTNNVSLTVNTLEGLHSNSKFINNSGLSISGTYFMNLGIFEIQGSGLVSYIGQATQFIRTPNIGNYYDLRSSFNSGSYNRMLTSDLVVLNNFDGSAGSTSTYYQIGDYNLQVGGQTLMQGGSLIIKSTSTGLLLFGGLLFLTTGSVLLSNNANLELRGGLFYSNNSAKNWSGGIWNFTTNNQDIELNSSSVVTFGQIKVSGITLGVKGTSAIAQLSITKLTALNSSSKFKPTNAVIYWYGVLSDLMSGGVLDLTTEGNQFRYALGGNQDIAVPYLNSYYLLGMQGSGVKKLTGNINVYYLFFAESSTLNYNGFTISGIQIYQDAGSVNRNQISGTFLTYVISGSGVKTLTGNVIANTFNKVGTSTINYNGFTITASVINWTYSSNSNENIEARTYNNLTIGGNGNVKTLLGNVVVTGTYSKTGSCTINLNGFTLKDGSGNDLA